MSVFSRTRNNSGYAVRNRDYIRTENKPEEGASQPTAPANPSQPEAK